MFQLENSAEIKNYLVRLGKNYDDDLSHYPRQSSGVRPIAIGEVLRRLIAKYVLSVAKGEALKFAELIN